MKSVRLLAAFLLMMAAAVFAASFVYGTPDEWLLTYHRVITTFVMEHDALALILFGLAYVVITALGTPGSAIMTLAGGMLFGAMTGGITSIIAASAGGTILFLAVRAGFAESLARRVPRQIGGLFEGFRRDGFFFLLFLRLTPLLPFFAVNLIAAAGGLRLIAFISATLIGIAPMNLTIAAIGAGLQDMMQQQAASYVACKAAQNWPCPGFSMADFVNGQILWPATLLGIIAIVPVVAKRWRRRAVSRAANV